MNKKLYKKRLIEGKILVKHYRSSMYALGKFIYNTLQEFPDLTASQLAKDIKLNEKTLYNLHNYFKKNIKLFGKNETEATFLVLVRAEKVYNVSLTNLTKTEAQKLVKDGLKTTNLVKKLETSMNKVIVNYNSLTVQEHLELEKIFLKLKSIIEGEFQIVA